MKFSNETKVGLFISGTAVVVFIFAWWIGVENPFLRSTQFYVTYNFAGGIEVGSPVRVSGIKVGKVEKIEFYLPSNPTDVALKEAGSADSDDTSLAIAPVRLKISVRNEAAPAVRKDSRFYINLAGLIGDRYLEITPGSIQSPQIQNGTVMAGVDPPRIDQLISQSFDLASKIKKVIEENKGDLTRSIELLYKLSGNLNNMLKNTKGSDVAKLINNLVAITSDIKFLTEKIDTPDGKKTIRLLHELLWRLEPLDPKTIRKFLQDEGLKVHLF